MLYKVHDQISLAYIMVYGVGGLAMFELVLVGFLTPSFIKSSNQKSSQVLQDDIRSTKAVRKQEQGAKGASQHDSEGGSVM